MFDAAHCILTQLRGWDLKSNEEDSVFAACCSVFARVSVWCVFVKLAKNKSRRVSGQAAYFFNCRKKEKNLCFCHDGEHQRCQIL